MFLIKPIKSQYETCSSKRIDLTTSSGRVLRTGLLKESVAKTSIFKSTDFDILKISTAKPLNLLISESLKCFARFSNRRKQHFFYLWHRGNVVGINWLPTCSNNVYFLEVDKWRILIDFRVSTFPIFVAKIIRYQVAKSLNHRLVLMPIFKGTMLKNCGRCQIIKKVNFKIG